MTQRILPDIRSLVDIAHRAGREIMQVYETAFETSYKDDNTPLTLADQKSHELIERELKSLYPEIPILSEEGKDIPYEERKQWTKFWLIDPLDGTKEFIKRNGEFTVNIALIEHQQPVCGVIHAPAKNVTYYAQQGLGAWKLNGQNELVQIRCRKPDDDGIIVVQSRSHPSPDMDEFLSQYKVKESISIGSSLKFCLVAEGKAHLYPRLGPMMEWDSAAGVCIVQRSGGNVTDQQRGTILYNTMTLKHGSVIVSA
jgi:3'(2'), 5'-bisphosphate nucleotidase